MTIPWCKLIGHRWGSWEQTELNNADWRWWFLEQVCRRCGDERGQFQGHIEKTVANGFARDVGRE